MAKLKGIRFCGVCGGSIPLGDYYVVSGSKDICGPCLNKKKTFRNILRVTMFGIFSFICYNAGKSIDFRLKDGESNDKINAMRISNVEYVISQFGNYADSKIAKLEEKIVELKQSNNEQNGRLKESIENTKLELEKVVRLHSEVKQDLNEGRLTDKQAQDALKNMLVKLGLLEERLQALLHSPEELIKKMLEPTVGIFYRDERGFNQIGSGVLFKREKVSKNNREYYKYTGFTAWHVWNSIFNYYEKTRETQPENLRRNPKLVIGYYGGNTEKPSKLFDDVRIIYPTKAFREYSSKEDMLFFEFEDTESLSVAELATDAEVDAAVQHGNRMYSVGAGLTGAPSLFGGIISSTKVKDDGFVVFQAYAFYGNSGGPIFDAKTMKIISINQLIHVSGSVLNMPIPDTAILYGQTIKHYRKLFSTCAVEEVRKILG